MTNGGPAFPRPHSWDESPVTGMHEGDRTEPHGAQSGMTLRDYFAAALAPVYVSLVDALPLDISPDERPRIVATSAYATADAMLAERAK